MKRRYPAEGNVYPLYGNRCPAPALQPEDIDMTGSRGRSREDAFRFEGYRYPAETSLERRWRQLRPSRQLALLLLVVLGLTALAIEVMS